MSIESQLSAVRRSLPEGVTLVAVSKTHPAAAIREAYDAGQRIFGESRPQELREKYEALPRDIEWHMIGHLQTNKVKYIAPFVALIHSVDSARLAEAIQKEAAKCGRVIDILLEIHVAREETKSGWAFDELEAWIATSPFAALSDVRVRGVMGIEKPRVGIINIGAEDEKGNALVKDAFPMMAEAPYHFVGSVEARDLFSDIADVCVADGFAGNLVLKTMEGVAMFMLKTMKQELMADTRSKIGAALAKPALRRLKHTLDYTEVGGAPLLGVQGAVVKAHGSSNAHAFSCAIDQAIKMVNGHVVEIIEKGVAKMNSQDVQ